jgi:general secretion pathway protein C
MLDDLTGKEEATLPSQVLHEHWLRLRQSGRHWLAPFGQRLAAVGAPRWRVLLLALSAAWLLANLARALWLLLPLQSAPPAAAPVVNPPLAAAGAAAAVDIDKMAGWHLFGAVGASARPAGAPGIEAQARDTALDLQLLGVASASAPALARAIIMAEGRQQQYAIGEQLPGGGKVILRKVLPDRVILDNNGRYETLWLYDPASTARQPQAAAPAVIDLRGNAQVTGIAQDYRRQLYQNPAGLAAVIQVTPALEDGKLLGYLLSPGSDARQFQQLGFKPGDIVTGVNGVALDDPQRALELYNLIRTAREAAFTVRRGTEEINLMVSLENNGGSQ